MGHLIPMNAFKQNSGAFIRENNDTKTVNPKPQGVLAVASGRGQMGRWPPIVEKKLAQFVQM